MVPGAGRSRNLTRHVACGMRGLGWLVDGPIKPTLNSPQTQNRDRLAVQARGGLDRGNISKPAPKSVKDGNSSQEAARPCMCVCACVFLCLTKQDISDDGLLWSRSVSTRETRKRQHQKTGRARVPTQGLPTESRILLIFRPDEYHGGQDGGSEV